MTLLTKSIQKPSNTKEQIISILSKEWPLSVKEIHQKLTNEFYLELTYQAVHKTISEMEEQKVIKNSDKKFGLDSNWLEGQKRFFMETEAKYNGKENNQVIDRDTYETQVLEFNDLSEFSVAMADILTRQMTHDMGDKIGAGVVNHLWFPTNFKFIDFDLLRKINEIQKETYLLVKQTSPFDKWLAEQYKKAGFRNLKMGVNLSDIEDDFAVRGGYAIQVHFSPETRKIMDEYYSRVNDLSGVLKEYVYKSIPKNKIKITATIYRNRDMVNMIKKQVISHFKEADK